jgi:murein DD-endopeptidase MepM/ murein hydrolase activator NlpD
MRILITFLTMLVSAIAAVLSATGTASAADPPCAPTKSSTAWTWPLQGNGRAGPAILRPFQPPRHRWEAGHRGLDLAGYARAPVLAAGSGVVLYAGRLIDRGVVVIGHGVIRTSYEPVEARLSVGTTVSAGEQIGTLDPGHCTSSPCLHWGLLTGHGHRATYYDPLLVLGCGQVRLEPVMAAPRSR